MATLVKMTFFGQRGKTVGIRDAGSARRNPKQPASGLIAYSRPSLPA
jgi:hypothetical protein